MKSIYVIAMAINRFNFFYCLIFFVIFQTSWAVSNCEPYKDIFNSANLALKHASEPKEITFVYGKTTLDRRSGSIILENPWIEISPDQDMAFVSQKVIEGLPKEDHERVLKLIEEKTKNGETKLYLKDLMPEKLAEKLNSYPSCGMANCFNAVQNWHHPARFDFDYTDVPEMTKYIKEEYLEIDGGVRYGDVVAFWIDEELIHTAVFISSTAIFHKPGYAHSQPWIFELLEAAINRYLLHSLKGRGRIRISLHRKIDNSNYVKQFTNP